MAITIERNCEQQEDRSVEYLQTYIQGEKIENMEKNVRHIENSEYLHMCHLSPWGLRENRVEIIFEE